MILSLIPTTHYDLVMIQWQKMFSASCQKVEEGGNSGWSHLKMNQKAQLSKLGFCKKLRNNLIYNAYWVCVLIHVNSNVREKFYLQHHTDLSFEAPSYDSGHQDTSGELQDYGLNVSHSRQRTVSGPSTVPRNRMRTMSSNLDDSFYKRDHADQVWPKVCLSISLSLLYTIPLYLLRF